MEANDGRQAQGAYIPQELLKEISKVNNRLLIGIPRERCEAEKRLPLTPEAVSVEELAKRLELCKHTRPVLKGRSGEELRAFIAESLEKRNPFYTKASITFDAEKMLTESDVHDISNALMKIL